MNSRNSSSFIGETPRKKKKSNESRLDIEISSLNEYGVLNLQYGMINDAQHFFGLALDCFAVKHQTCKLTQDKNVQWKDIMQSVLPFQGSHSPLNVVKSLKSPAMNDALEYDEGVRAYIDTMDTDEGISDSLQSAALYYNVAQTFVHLNNYSDAMSWFDLALMCVKLVPESRTPNSIHTTTVKIRHNLGYCYYRLARSTEAKYCFEKALVLAEEDVRYRSPTYI